MSDRSLDNNWNNLAKIIDFTCGKKISLKTAKNRSHELIRKCDMLYKNLVYQLLNALSV